MKKFALWGLAAVGLLFMPPFVGSRWQDALINVVFITYLCVTWNVIAGLAGQFAIGQPVFLAAGAYTSTILLLRLSVSPWAGILAGVVVAGALAAGLGFLAFRYKVRGLYFALLTFASLIVAQTLATDWGYLGGASGLSLPLGNSFTGFVWASRLPYYYIGLGLLCAGFAITRSVYNSRLGWILSAVGQDEEAAASIGIPVSRAKLIAFVVSAMLSAPAGTFYAQFNQLVSPDAVLTFNAQLLMLVGTIVGGIGTITGPLIGGGLIGILNQLLQNLPLNSRVSAALGMSIYGLFLLVISVYAPKGLVGLWPRGGSAHSRGSRPFKTFFRHRGGLRT